MMSFYNAGYKKQEIEDAARALYEHPSMPLSHPSKPIPEEIKKPISKVTKPITPVSTVPMIKPAPSQIIQPKPEEKPQPTETKQIISKYEEKTKPRGKLIIILLIISLFILISFLIGIFIFKQELIDFFSTWF